jgi:hypothetical protein
MIIQRTVWDFEGAPCQPALRQQCLRTLLQAMAFMGAGLDINQRMPLVDANSSLIERLCPACGWRPRSAS